MPDGAETITDADLSRLQNPKFHFEKNLRFQSSKNNMDLNYQILDFDAGGYCTNVRVGLAIDWFV